MWHPSPSLQFFRQQGSPLIWNFQKLGTSQVSNDTDHVSITPQVIPGKRFVHLLQIRGLINLKDLTSGKQFDNDIPYILFTT